MATTTTYIVSGMSCGHCVAAVTKEIAQLSGVGEVSIDLVPDGESTVVVTSEATLPEDAVREALAEAGYTLTEVPR